MVTHTDWYHISSYQACTGCLNYSVFMEHVKKTLNVTLCSSVIWTIIMSFDHFPSRFVHLLGPGCVNCWRAVYWTAHGRCLTRMAKYAYFFYSLPCLLNTTIQIQHAIRQFVISYGIVRKNVTNNIHAYEKHGNPLWYIRSSIFCTTF